MATGRTIKSFRYGIAPYRYDNLEGVMDTTGRVILPPTYEEIEGFGGGVSRVLVIENDWEHKYGFIDTLGNEIVPPIYDDADSWYDRSMRFAEVIVVGKEGKYGVFDYSGKELTPLKYRSVSDFRSGFARVYDENGCGYINTEGEEVIKPKFQEGQDFIGDIAIVRLNGKYGWINQKGEIVVECAYDWVSNFSNGWAKVKKDGATFYIDREGNTRFEEQQFEGIGYYSYGLACAHKDGKWGFIDVNGNVAIPFEYKKVGNFEHGRAWVWKDDFWGHIDTNGAIVTPLIYERASQFGRHSHSGDSLYASVMLNGNYGLVNMRGELVVACEYFGMDHFYGNIAKVKKKIGEVYKFGFVDTDGNEFIKCIYDKAEKFEFNPKLAKVYLENKGWGVVNAEGKEIVPCRYHSIEFIDHKIVARSGSEVRNFDYNGNSL